MSIEKAQPPVLNYENVEGLPAGPTLEQEAFASIAQSLKRIADHLVARTEISRASVGGGDTIAHMWAEVEKARSTPAQPAPAAEKSRADEHFREIKRAQRIVDEMKAWRATIYNDEDGEGAQTDV